MLTSGPSDLFEHEEFCETFGYHLLHFKDVLLHLQGLVPAVHARKRDFSPADFAEAAQDVQLLSKILNTMKRLYVKHSDGFLETLGIRWNVLCLLLTTSPVAAALAEYLECLGSIQKKNGKLADAIDLLRLTQTGLESFVKQD